MMKRRFAWCLAAILAASVPASADDWTQWLGTNRDGVWKEVGILKSFPKGGPKKLWDVPVGAGYSGPAVANGKVYLTDRVLAPGAKVPGNAFSQAKIEGTERLLCFNATTGEEAWKFEYPCMYGISYASGPRCTPTVDGDRVYFLGAMGHLHCCKTSDGTVNWKKPEV